MSGQGPGAGATGPVQAVVRVSLGAPELGEVGPLSLRVGQRLLAEVLAVQAETGRTILSLAGRRMEAQVPAGLRQGEVVRLAVAEVLPDRLVFRVEPADVPEVGAGAGGAGSARAAGSASGAAPLRSAAGAGEAPALPARAPRLNAGSILVELDLPDTAPMRAAVEALIERQQPLSREALSQVRQAIAELPGDPLLNARAAASLRQDRIPLTVRSVELARAALVGPSGPPGAPLGQLLAALIQALDGDTDTAPDGVAARGPATQQGEARTRGREAQQRAVMQLAVGTAEPTELERVVRLFSRAPEAVLVARQSARGVVGVKVSEGVDAEQALAPRLTTEQTETVRAGTRPELAARRPEVSVQRALGGATDMPEALPAELPKWGPGASATGQAARLGVEEPDGDARSLLLALADALPDDADAEGAPTETAPLRARELASALHDRIELQQLRSAVRGLAERTVGAPPALPEGSAATVQLVAQVGSEAAALAAAASEGEPRAALPPSSGDGAGGAGGVTGRAEAALAPLVLSIPLAIGGHLRTLDLVVEREPGGRRAGGGEAIPALRASFTLQLERLGEVDADVRLQGALVRCRLRASTPGVVAHLSNATGRLRERLERAGLEVQALECSVSEPAAETPSTTALRHVAVEV